MSLVTIKPKFQVTIPAKLRKSISLQEGDLVEALLVEGGILLRPKAVVDRSVAASRIEDILSNADSPEEDIGKSPQNVMDEIVADIADSRKHRRKLNA